MAILVASIILGWFFIYLLRQIKWLMKQKKKSFFFSSQLQWQCSHIWFINWMLSWQRNAAIVPKQFAIINRIDSQSWGQHGEYEECSHVERNAVAHAKNWWHRTRAKYAWKCICHPIRSRWYHDSKVFASAKSGIECEERFGHTQCVNPTRDVSIASYA